MNKQLFLAQLRKGLFGLPQEEIEERLAFYGEMIDDRIEEGLTEEQAVAAVGAVEEIVAQVVAETPLLKIAREKHRSKRRMNGWEITLLVLGSPIWLSLGIAVVAVGISLYASLWAVVIALWAGFGGLVGGAVGGLAAGIASACRGQLLPEFALLGAGCVCAGLAIFWFFGCKAATKGIVLLTKKVALRIKILLIGKETEK